MNQRLGLAPPGAGLVVGLLLLIVSLWQIGPPEDKVVFLDVGQGDAILLQSGTQQILIDGGPDATVLQRLGEELPWFDRRIEVVVATHPDQDHIAGLVHVVERYEVGLVVLPKVSHTSQLQAAWLEHIQQAVANKGTQYRFANAGQRLQLKGLNLDVLHPALGENFDRKTNNASVSVRGDFHQLSFLLTGDAEALVEQQLVARYGSRLDVNVVKAGHHGSKTSTSQALLDATSPAAVVISAGRNNQYGHPHPDVLERLTPYHIFRTDEQGSVRFVRQDGRWLVARPGTDI